MPACPIIPAVKYARLFLLALLCVLLPIRGAMALTMSCATGAATGAPAAVSPSAHDPHAGHRMHTAPAEAHEAAAEASPDASPSAGDHPATCALCASGCCLASMVGAAVSLAEPVPSAPAQFAAFAPRIPAFQSDGQERPPRTC